MASEQVSTSTVVEPDVATDHRTRRLPPYNVVILNDEEHSFPYVIELLTTLFRHSLSKAEELTVRIDKTGRAVVYTTHKELAELKRDQVIAYGPDPLCEGSKGPLRCYVEPAPMD
jgi:ATP-dependent Clp protease adaptor protein ClpS